MLRDKVELRIFANPKPATAEMRTHVSLPPLNRPCRLPPACDSPAMAKFGPYSTLATQISYSAQFAVAFEYIAEILRPDSAAFARISALPVGSSEKIQLADGSFAIEQVYTSRARSDGFFESHRKFIDIQVIVAGEELMEVADISRLTPTQEYDEERDLSKFADDGAASILRMHQGDIALFFPRDGHMPSLQVAGPGLVRKTVVKVPVSGTGVAR